MEEPRTTFSGLFSRRLELWPEELEKPTEAAFQKAAGLVKRTGTDKHFAVAAMLMPSGITMRELTATGCDTQRNVYGDLIAEGVVRPVDMEPRDGQKVYRLSVYRDLIAEGVLSHLANIEPRDEEKVYRLTASSAYRSDASIPAADISAEGTSASSGAARPLSRRRHQRASKHADRSPDIGKLLDAALRHPLVSTILGGLVVAAIAAAVTVLV